MRIRALSLVCALAVGLWMPSVSPAQTAAGLARWAGTWSLNLERSKFDPGPAPVSRNTLRVSVADGGLRVVSDTVGLDGNSGFTEILAKFDGADHTLMNAATPTVRTYKWVNDTTQEYVTKVNGQVTTTTRAVLSADGKTQTLTTSGTNAAGRRVNNVTVFERQ